MASQPKVCTNKDCNVAIDGKCVEGFALDQCPHMTQISVEDLEEVNELGETPREVRVMSLSMGEPLNCSEAAALQCRRISRTVGIIGPNDAGKTSLVASVYDLLQDGPVANVSFAGSSTLVGFEKVCHDARVASRRDVPYTERTTQGAEATFFHLDLRQAESDVISLFIGDRSGEDYLAATDDLARAEDFFELRRADVVTLLVNGEHLASSEHRHQVKAITPQIVDALVEARSLRRGVRLAVVLTKKDSVLASTNSDRVQRDFDAMVDAITFNHSDYLGAIERFIVAASPKDSAKVKRGTGVDQLLLFWLCSSVPPVPIQPSISISSRMIDHLGEYGEVVL